MLAKTLGFKLVSKLRAILLMEADFNATNKIMYGVRMMKNVCDHRLMPEEIYSGKNRMADNGTLTKTLFYHVTRQARVPAAIALVDASNCYDMLEEIARASTDTRIRPSLTLVLTGPRGQIGGLGVTAFY